MNRVFNANLKNYKKKFLKKTKKKKETKKRIKKIWSSSGDQRPKEYTNFHNQTYKRNLPSSREGEREKKENKRTNYYNKSNL